MFEEFPINHNLILFGQTDLLCKMSLKVNEDIKSRITYSTVMLKLVSDDIEAFVMAQLDKCGLGHNVFTEEAIALVTQSSDGILRVSEISLYPQCSKRYVPEPNLSA
jgi:type II secretory pathway predicted ATPase ExeA